jgi:predicted phosphodiesterase
MRIGILADIHENLGHLRWAIDVLREQGADRLVVLGDVFELGHRLRETVDLLAEAGAIGVWGNHDFGLCGDNPRSEDRRRYGERVLAFMGSLKPRLEIDGSLFVHVEPWLNPEKTEDLWYFDGPPETTEQAARSFEAVPNRLIFVGHYHRWLLATLEGVQPWVGDRPIVLNAADRYLAAIHAVCAGKCALLDTDTHELFPFSVETSQSESPS